MAVVLYLLLFAMTVVSSVNGHGRLLDPVSRSSAWIKNTPGAVVNYNDNQLFCGGSSNQWTTNGGKCGVCGDPWQGPRDNEAGGKYARGIITGTYTQGGLMDVHVQLTAYHKGWFEFRLCVNDDATKPATQECLDTNLLNVVTSQGHSTRFDINEDRRREYYLKVQLPDHVICRQCVLQWKYNTGNSWGVDPDTGKGCVGCGPQEQFYGCSDITIQANAGWPRRPTVATNQDTTNEPDVTTAEKPKSNECRAVSAWTGGDVLDRWCNVNCELGFCPAFLCTCTSETEDIFES